MQILTSHRLQEHHVEKSHSVGKTEKEKRELVSLDSFKSFRQDFLWWLLYTMDQAGPQVSEHYIRID